MPGGQPAAARTSPLTAGLKIFGVIALAGAMLGLVVYAVLPTVHVDDRHAVEALEGGYPLVGAWLGEWPSEENETIDAFDDKTGIRIDLVDVFLDWRTPWDNVSYTVEHIAFHGALPILTWEPRDFTHAEILEGTATIDLRDGRTVTIDEYLGEFADGVCDAAGRTDQPVLIRTLHEMNGHWYPWGIGYEGGAASNSDESYQQAWIKIHDMVHDRCDEGVLFIYAMNHFSGEGTTFMGGYPGDDYVDFIGIDGYNWGDRAEWGWQSFDVLFKEPYCAAVAESIRPVIITETGSTEAGGDKEEWMRDTVGVLLSGEYPQVRGIVYFDETKFEIEIGGEMDWEIDSSPRSLEGFSEAAQEVQDVREAGKTWDPPAPTGPDC